MHVVVVESPAKAKTINKYLGKDFKVLASYGHVRDLPPKNGSVRPDEDFDMSWQIDERSEKHLDAIAEALNGADHLLLATDPDREGEAISWHVQKVLEERKLLNGVNVQRVVFHEITKDAVLDAIQNPREVKQELVDAYLARRALDYLVGFTLSPVLWRKLPGSRSAGRVQSVALRLICERESEIEAFNPQEYWTVEALFNTTAGAAVTARLTHLDGRKLDKFDLGDEAAATAAVQSIERHAYKVSSVERKTVKRNPSPPFTTSTLQQEASRKLGFGATRTMRTAQKLYEGFDIGGETVGLITYMRTDSVTLSQEAVTALRSQIVSTYGQQYCPETPNVYRSKSKNAQEAHEAIRPTDAARRPESLATVLGPDELKLYDLIWKRTISSAMESAALEQVAVDIAAPDKSVVLRANGSVVKFDGFLRIYQEGKDETQDDTPASDSDRILPPMNEGDAMDRKTVTPEQHFTKPPPRFTEASLVKRMEELGIGRPSTYASILSVLQDRKYVRLESRRFIPEDRGRLVTAFLSGFFERYVEYNFTAELENKLDDVSNGDMEWRAVLRDFWRAFSAAVKDTNLLRITNVIDALDQDLGPHFFQATEERPDPRACLVCEDGRLGLKLGRNGGFIGCSNYPECKYTRALAVGDDETDAALMAGPKELGIDPGTELMVTMRKGPFGIYLQLGEPVGKEKPKRAGLMKGLDPAEVTLETALAILSLPREVGPDPSTGEMILAGVGRFGPYLKQGAAYTKLKADDDVLTIGLNRAVTVIAESPKRPVKQALRNLGPHPEDEKPIDIFEGRYGPYLKHGKTNASLPRGMEVADVTIEEAISLLAERAAKGTKGKAAKKKAPAKKKKAAKKKAASKKKASTKSKPAADKAPEPTA